MLENAYYGQIGQKDVERLLGKYGKDGSFLLRDSQSESGALCLCIRKAPFVHTYRIVNSSQGWAVETENKKKVQWFQSLDKLIESYKVTPYNMVPLLYPLEKSHLNEEERQIGDYESIPQDGSGGYLYSGKDTFISDFPFWGKKKSHPHDTKSM